MERMESGVVQFGEDWPGLFLRGDSALVLGTALTDLLGSVEKGQMPSKAQAALLQGLASSLLSVDVRRRDSTPTKLKEADDCLAPQDTSG